LVKAEITCECLIKLDLKGFLTELSTVFLEINDKKRALSLYWIAFSVLSLESTTGNRKWITFVNDMTQFALDQTRSTTIICGRLNRFSFLPLCTVAAENWKPLIKEYYKNGVSWNRITYFNSWCIFFCLVHSSFEEKKSVNLILEKCHMCFRYYWPLMNLSSWTIFP